MPEKYRSDTRASSLLELAERIQQANRSGDVQGRNEAHTAFHMVLYESCDFPALIDMIKMLWARHPWDELLSLPGLTSARDHHQIAELAAARDAHATAERLRAHLHSVRDALNAARRDRDDAQAEALLR